MMNDSNVMRNNLPFTKAYKEAQRRWNDGLAQLNKIKADEGM